MPRVTRRNEKRREIIKRAAAVFEAEGYHTTNLEAVASAAGLKKPTLYHYFSSKSEILFGIHEEMISHLIARHEGRGHMTPVDSLRELCRDVMDNIEHRLDYMRVFFEHHRELSAADQATIAEHRDRYAAAVQAEIVRGIESGEFRADIDPRLAMLGLFGMLNWAYQWYRPGGPMPATQVADAFLDIFLRGVSGDGVLAPASGENGHEGSG